jgi:hypothetical protein
MKYAVENLKEVSDVLCNVDLNLIKGKETIFFFDSQYDELDNRIVLRPLYEHKVLRPICKTMGLDQTNLPADFLKFKKAMGLDVCFETFVTADFCRRKNIPIITRSKCMINISDTLSLNHLSPEYAEIILSSYIYDDYNLRKIMK